MAVCYLRLPSSHVLMITPAVVPRMFLLFSGSKVDRQTLHGSGSEFLGRVRQRSSGETEDAPVPRNNRSMIGDMSWYDVTTSCDYKVRSAIRQQRILLYIRFLGSRHNCMSECVINDQRAFLKGGRCFNPLTPPGEVVLDQSASLSLSMKKRGSVSFALCSLVALSGSAETAFLFARLTSLTRSSIRKLSCLDTCATQTGGPKTPDLSLTRSRNGEQHISKDRNKGKLSYATHGLSGYSATALPTTRNRLV